MPKFELQKGHRVFLGIAGLAFVGSAVGSWFSYQDFKDLEVEAEGIQAQINTARNKIRKIEDLEREVIILRQNLQHYVRILPSDAEVNEFYRNLQEFVNFSRRADHGVEPAATARPRQSIRSVRQSRIQTAF